MLILDTGLASAGARSVNNNYNIADININVQGKHNALTDAVAQAKAVQQAYKKLKL